jgi:hypothetical protein
MKTGKELRVNNFNEYNVIFGSINNKHPKAVFINISAWIDPKHSSEENYQRIIRNNHKKIKQVLYNRFASNNELFIKDRTIVDFDVRESGIKFGKRSFMNCEITLFVYEEIGETLDSVKEELEDITQHVIDRVFKCDDAFSYHKRKK